MIRVGSHTTRESAVAWLRIALAGVGLFIAGVLTYSHLGGKTLYCTGSSGCHSIMPDLFRAARPDGRCAIVVRHFPLPGHDLAFPLAVKTEACKDDNAVRGAYGGDPSHLEGQVNEVTPARRIEAQRRVQRDLKLARRLHIPGTPTLLFTICSTVLAGGDPSDPIPACKESVETQICTGTCVQYSCRRNASQVCGCFPPELELTDSNAEVHTPESL